MIRLKELILVIYTIRNYDDSDQTQQSQEYNYQTRIKNRMTIGKIAIKLQKSKEFLKFVILS